LPKIKVTYVKSSIGYPENQKATIVSLGLRRLHQSVECEDTRTARGMIMKVRHLVKVEEVA
jgi:large subunit ribosomal protein L30